jgi:mannose-1-phosphate guanylyltransferase
MEKYLPEMVEVFQEAIPEFGQPGEADAIHDAYSQCKNISIDYGIMEKATNVYVCLGNFTWSDLGSWASIHEISSKDDNNNVVSANALTYETKNCIIKGAPDKLIVTQGLNGYLVGEFGNVIIVCEKDKEEQFRRFVNDVKTRSNSNDFI